MDGILIVLGCGVLVGALSGLVGIGGGILLVPLLLYVSKLDMHIAAGTSLAIVIPTAIFGSMIHFSRGNVDWRLAGLVALGSVAGSVFGAYAGPYLPGDTLKRVFAVVLVLISLKVVSDAFR